MNESTLAWLMMPDAPNAPTTVEEFLGRPTWMGRAACRGQRAGEWVSPSSVAPYTLQRDVCAGCPVRAQCLDYALADPSLVGCWGATNDKERREMRRAVA